MKRLSEIILVGLLQSQRSLQEGSRRVRDVTKEAEVRMMRENKPKTVGSLKKLEKAKKQILP